MVHAQVSYKYIHFTLMHRIDNIFPVLLIKYLINQDSEPTTPQKLATGTKLSVSNLRTLFCPCVVQKATAHVYKKALRMRQQSQNGFWGIFVGTPQHQKGYLIYEPSTHKIFSSHGVVFDEKFPSSLAYTSHTYSDSLTMRPAFSHITYATSSHKKPGDIIILHSLKRLI